MKTPDEYQLGVESTPGDYLLEYYADCVNKCINKEFQHKQELGITRLFKQPVSKDAFGKKAAKEYKVKAEKFRPSLLPPEAVIEGAKAMEFGAKKYGVDQWKTVDMQAREFVDALERHLLAYKQGEKLAQGSQVSHLGHIIANCGILLSRFEKRE